MNKDYLEKIDKYMEQAISTLKLQHERVNDLEDRFTNALLSLHKACECMNKDIIRLSKNISENNQ